jgi:quercetin dioxygenase-like cupin family protein
MSERIEKDWGHEIIVHADERYTCKHLVYTEPGQASSLHYHRNKHECFTVANGVFELEVGDAAPTLLVRGEFVVLPPGMKHRLRFMWARTGAGLIVESSSFDDPLDCVRLVPSEKRRAA